MWRPGALPLLAAVAGLVLLLAVICDARRTQGVLESGVIPAAAAAPVFAQVGAGIAVSNAPKDEIELGNSGLKPDGSPVRGKVVGPFTSVRATTLPWNMRHLIGQQINGAPEPLVYAPVYTFEASEPLPKTTAKDMFKNPDLYSMYFRTPNAVYNVRGMKSRESQPFVDPRAFEIVAPQPPPFVPPRVPTGGGEGGEGEEAGGGDEATEPSAGETD